MERSKETLELRRNMLSGSILLKEGSKADVLLWAAIELIFFIIFSAGLCFGFVSWG